METKTNKTCLPASKGKDHVFASIYYKLILCLAVLVLVSCDPKPEPKKTCPNLTVNPIPGQLIIQPKVPVADREDLQQHIPQLLKDLRDLFNIDITTGVNYEVCGCGFILMDNIPPSVGLQESDAVARSDQEDEGDFVKHAGNNYPVQISLPVPVPSVEFKGTENGNRDLPSRPLSVKVAVVDSGLDLNHKSVENKVWINPADPPPVNGTDDDSNCLTDDIHGYDFLNNTALPWDLRGHGTHVNGIISSEYPSDQIALQLINQKFIDNDTSTLFEAVCGIYDAIAKGADIMNLSWGYYGETSNMLKQAVKAAEKESIFIITSVGNDDINIDSCDHWPSGFSVDFDHVISVAALDTLSCGMSTRIAPFSNYGQRVDIAAPGTLIESAFPDYPNLPGTRLEKLSGTSMAAAFVTREASIFKANHPGATPLDIKNHITVDLGRTLDIINKPTRLDKWIAPTIGIFTCL